MKNGIVSSLLHRSPGEWLWGGLGMGAATLSASFAGYMALVGPSTVRFPAAADFGMLAHLGPRTMPSDSHVTPLLQGSSDRLHVAMTPDAVEPSSTKPGSAPVDFSPTGSVDGDKAAAAGGGTGAPTLKSFILRDVFDGKALVESRTAITLVSPGTVLDGAGEVLAIRRQGDAWVVATSRGLIVSAAR